MTGPEGEGMEGWGRGVVSIGGAQKHPAELLHPGIHLLPSSGCPPTPPFPRVP